MRRLDTSRSEEKFAKRVDNLKCDINMGVENQNKEYYKIVSKVVKEYQPLKALRHYGYYSVKY